MTDPFAGTPRNLPHLIVPRPGRDVAYRGRGGGSTKKRRTIGDRAGHAQRLADEVTDALELAREQALEIPEEAPPEGFSLCVEGWSDEPGYNLALGSLGSDGAKLLTVLPAEAGRPERALIWMPFGAEAKFLRKLDEFATQDTSRGRPKNEALIANIKEIRLAILREFWQDAEDFPEGEETRWWEVWFASFPDRDDVAFDVRSAVSALGLRMAEQTLNFPDRIIGQIQATPARLSELLTTNAVVTEVHHPPAASEILDVDAETRGDLIADLESRLVPAPQNAPAVCLLDTGIMSAHRLLRSSVDAQLSVLRGTTPADQYKTHGHGTPMAGLSLIGDLASALTGTKPLELRHRLESVKVLQGPGARQNAAPPFYGVTIAEAANLVEIERPGRRRIFSMPITDGTVTNDGRPTSWSASLDALSFGTDISASRRGVSLLGRPDAQASRLFLVSAGNVDQRPLRDDYLDVCDTYAIEDPAQAWNVLTVGAFTELTDITDPHLRRFSALAPAGELSPYSRTSLTWRSTWPVKPDIMMEGGNMLVESSGERWQDSHLELLVPSRTGDLTTANATSAATAQTARLCALALERYPKLWPETVRGLLVHSAEWTSVMRRQITPKKLRKQDRVQMLRRYGWGVPTEDRVLSSADNAVTMIVEDEFLPFERSKSGVSMRALRLHQLPWPRDQLLDLFDTEVELRVTLSYFVEPNPSNKGWVRYRYPSHALRFDLKQPTESPQQFQQRIAQEASQEEADNSSRTARRPADKRWLIGRDGRSRGSLHADIWTAAAAELADSGWLAIIPVGGWWKDNKRTDRVDLPIRYSLLVSLKSAVSADIYTPIANQIGIETVIEI